VRQGGRFSFNDFLILIIIIIFIYFFCFFWVCPEGCGWGIAGEGLRSRDLIRTSFS
jgi:hypothetical protein